MNIILVVVFVEGADWAPLWVAGRLAWSDPSSIYDFALITEAQRPILGETVLRPFVYPPSALLFIAPFAWLPFYASFIVFVGITAAAFAREGLRIGAHWGLLAAPPVVLAALVGQTSFLVLSLALAGLSQLRSRADLAGALIGLAAAIKPTIFILAPIALIAGGHWRAMLFAGVSGLCAVALSALCFGVEPWFAWIDAIPRFQSLFLNNETLVRTAISPYALGVRYGYESGWIIVACGAAALAGVIVAFRSTEDVAARSVALFGGALLMTPYAMNYELALLAPAVMTIPLRRLRDIALPLLFGASLLAAASAAGLVLVMTWLAARTIRPRLIPDEALVQRRVDVPA
jgi:hypothetical protein